MQSVRWWTRRSGREQYLLVAIIGVEAAFAARMHEAVDLFESLGLALEAEAIQTQISSHVVSDPRKEITADAALSSHTSLVAWINGRAAAVRASLAARCY